MAAAIVITVLAVLHILSAAAWFGALAFFLSALGPGVAKFTPAASLEFLAKVGPGQVRFFAGTATSTIIFGLGLLYAYFGSNYSAWPTTMVIGFTLGLLAYLVALLVAIPAFLKADRIAHQIMNNPQPGPPPPELATTLKRGRYGTITIGILLFLTLLYMIVTAFPF